MNLLRFDTIPYAPPARAEARFPVLVGQARCSTGVRIRGVDAEAVAVVVSWHDKMVQAGETKCG